MDAYDNPKITVIMSVYNGEKYLHQAISSTLDQTFKNFEFLIIDDGSTDKTAKLMMSYDDSRIKTILNEENIGHAKSLNKGISLAKGEYIARMDQDDVMMRKRLETQVQYLDDNQDIAVVGSNFQTIDEKNNISGKLDWPIGLMNNLFFINTGKPPVGHPGVLIRKESIMKVGCYGDKFLYCEDLDLWLRLYLNGYVTNNIPEYLTRYRIHSNQVTDEQNEIQIKNHKLAFYDYYKTSTGHDIQFDKINKYLNILWEKNIISDNNLDDTLSIYIKLLQSMHNFHKRKINVKKLFNLLFCSYKQNLSIINRLKFHFKSLFLNYIIA